MSEMNKKPTNIPAGALFTITAGEYNEYNAKGVFRALREIPTAELLATYLREHAAEMEPHSFDDSRFLAWVARQGYLEPLESFEWHLSDYGRATEMSLEGPDAYELPEEPKP